MSLKELRERAQLRQVDVAERLEVDQAAVSNWERGVNKPARKHQRKLAALYGCSVEELSGKEVDELRTG